MVGTDHGPAEYVLDALEAAEDPVSAGEVQRRIADEGLDATTAAIEGVCDELVVTGDVEPADWVLEVTGAVSRPLRLERAGLAQFAVERVTDDFECVEGWVAEDLSWRGVRAGSVVDHAEPTVEDGHVLVHSMDGEFACSFPRDRVADALLAFELGGEALPVEHGGPARLVPTDDGSACWESVKWVSKLELRDGHLEDGDTAEEMATARLEDTVE